jgi:hypothetical protein
VDKSHVKLQVLGSAYLFGATTEHLNDVYEAESDELEPWQDAPGEITMDDWRDFLGKREYVKLNFSHLIRADCHPDISELSSTFSKTNWSALAMTGKLWSNISFLRGKPR